MSDGRVAVLHQSPGVPGQVPCGGVACYARRRVLRSEPFSAANYCDEHGDPLQTVRVQGIGRSIVWRYVCGSCGQPFGARDLAQVLVGP